MSETVRNDTLPLRVAAGLIVLIDWSLSANAQAACNLRAGTRAAFDGAQGQLNRPFAGPGESVEVSVRPCDTSPGLGALATDHNVTVLFTQGGGEPTAVVLTGDSSCSSVTTQLAACEVALGGKALCVAGADAGLEIVDRGGSPALAFRFPDSDARCNGGTDAGTPCIVDADCTSNDCSASINGRTLSGAALIAVTSDADPLPCDVIDCATATDTIACIDRFYQAAGSCTTETLGTTFPAFTALPSPNIYAVECVESTPPCDPLAGAGEVRIALDAHGNALVPFIWDGVREQLEGEAVARIVRGTLAQDISVPGQSFVASFSPEGRRLAPVFEPKTGFSGALTFFGSADAPYTILRLARGSDAGAICAGGAHDGAPCNVEDECAGGSCVQASCIGGGDDGDPCRNDSECSDAGECGPKLFDFGPLVVDSGQGPAVLLRDTTEGLGRCENDPSIPCTSDCGPDGACVNYKLEASTTVPLDGLLPRDELASFAVTERVDGVDLNNDGDILDLVMTIRDQHTGDLIPLGAPAAICGIPDDPSRPVFGRAVVRSSDSPLLLPAGATADGYLAFLEPESGQKNCDINSDDETDDAYLRIFATEGIEVARGIEIPADEATVVNDRALAISNGKVFFRTSEQDATDKRVERASNGSFPSPANGNSSRPVLSPDGRWLAFVSAASDLITGETNAHQSIFVKDLASGTVYRASQDLDGAEPDSNSFRPSVRRDGTIAFDSFASNLDKFDPEALLDIDGDVFVGTRFGNPNRISDTNAGTDQDGSSANPSIGTSGTAFESDSTNLIAPGEDSNSRVDIYFKPTFASAKIRISDPPGAAQANGDSRNASIAQDVMVVAFDSNATNLVSPDSTLRDVFVYDGTGAVPIIEKVSVDYFGGTANGTSELPRISGDGRFVAYNSTASDLVVGDTNGSQDVFVRDRWFGKIARASVSTGGGQANGASSLAAISDDGRYVMFSSAASNLVTGDANGNTDYFVHDRVARTTIRVNVTRTGAPVDGETGGTAGDIAEDGYRVAWSSNDPSYPDFDNGFTQIYVREPEDEGFEQGDPEYGETAFDLNGDGNPDDVVLRAFDLLNPPAIVDISEADAAKVANGKVLLTTLRPSSASGDVVLEQTYRFWSGGAATTIGMTAYPFVALSDGMLITDSVIAVIDHEATQFTLGSVETGNANGDGQSDDGYLAVRNVCSPIGSCDWSIPNGAGGWPLMAPDMLQPLGASGAVVVMAADESRHGPSGTNLNGDGDTLDAVIHTYDADTSTVSNLALAVDDFVIGERTNVPACGGDVHVLAFRVSEADQGGTNLNGVAYDPDSPTDVDSNDSVLQVHDLVSGDTINVGQAATPCVFSDCDPRTPYRVDGSKVTFLTLESDQGNGLGQDISGEGNFGDLVVQQYDFCTGVLTPLERVAGDSERDPTKTVDDSRVSTAVAGRCDSGPCIPGPGACEAGSFCEQDVCLTPLGMCERHLSIPCASDADCARCIHLYPGACQTDDDCVGGASCASQMVTVVESALDSDGDGVNDSNDDCPNDFDPSANDADGDGVPDACDLRSCRPFPRGDCREAGDGKAKITIRDGNPDSKDRLVWKWGGGEATTKAEFGSPLSTDAYEVCLYSNGLLAGGTVPPGGTCDTKGRKPCWKEFDRGYKYKDAQTTPQGIFGVTLKEGEAGNAGIKVSGKGARLVTPDLAAISGQLVVQLVNNTTGICFDAGFSEPFQLHTSDQLKASGGVSVVTTTTTTTLAPCPDADNDGFADVACGGLDCYDGNDDVFPGQTGYFTVHRGDGSFDYDCSGGEEKLIGVGSCQYSPFLLACLSSGVGSRFCTSRACGQSGAILTGCSQSGTTCTASCSGSAVEQCH